MSGNAIGGFVGGAIGFVVSSFNPAGFQWGCMLERATISDEKERNAEVDE